LTFAQVERMARARLKANWDETAALLACIDNVRWGRGPYGKHRDYNPYRRASRAPSIKLSRESSLEVLAGAWVK
jgi:hypothetical protein